MSKKYNTKQKYIFSKNLSTRAISIFYCSTSTHFLRNLGLFRFNASEIKYGHCWQKINYHYVIIPIIFRDRNDVQFESSLGLSERLLKRIRFNILHGEILINKTKIINVDIKEI